MKTMISFLTFCMIVLISCNQESLPESFQIGTTGRFKTGAEYLSNKNSLQFKITEINDSRCPSDVVCVWQGEAVVKIAVESPVSGTLELNTFDHPKDTLARFSFELVGVSPYPVSTETIELADYDVTIKIEELE